MSRNLMAKDIVPSKLEELEVMFVSGVNQPATGERFILMKDANSADAFLRWAKKFRADNPDAAAEMDMFLSAGDWGALQAALKSAGGPSYGDALQTVLAERYRNAPRTWDAIEPDDDAIDEIETADPVAFMHALAYKSIWSQERRDAHQASGGYFAGPHQSFPLASESDVAAAYVTAKHAQVVDGSVIQARVARWANENGKADALPAQKHLTGGAKHEAHAKDKGAGTLPPIDDDQINVDGKAPAVNTQPHPIQSKKKGVVSTMSKNIAGVLAHQFAAAAGMEVVPAGTQEMLSKFADASEAVTKTISGGAGKDDNPVGDSIRLMDEYFSQGGIAPKTEQIVANGKDPIRDQQPDLLRGTPFAGSVGDGTVLSGTPFAGSVDTQFTVSGKPVTKSINDLPAFRPGAPNDRRKTAIKGRRGMRRRTLNQTKWCV